MLGDVRNAYLVFTTESKRLLTYRAQFWFELILSSVIELLVILVVWKAVFVSSQSENIANYNLTEMLLYVSVATFFSQATKGSGMGTFQRDIYDGSLTKYLIYPLSFFSYKVGTFFPRAMFAVIQLFLTLILMYFLSDISYLSVFSFFNFFVGLLSLTLACFIFFLMLAMVEMLAFWFDNVWTLSFVLQICIVFLSGRAVPIDLFPKTAQIILNNSPFPFLAFVPAKIFIGGMTQSEAINSIVIGCVWVFVFWFLARNLYRLGLNKYSGVGQ